MSKLWTPDKTIVPGYSRRAFLSSGIKALLAAGIAPFVIEPNARGQSSVVGGKASASGNAAFGSVVPASVGGGGGSAPTIVHAAKGAGGGSNVTTITTPSTTAGNMLVIGSTADSATISSISDNIGGATGWTSIAVIGAPGSTELWYKKNIPSGITTITVTRGAGGNSSSDICHEVSGASTTAPFTTGEFATTTTQTDSAHPITGALSSATAAVLYFAVCRASTGSGNPITFGINSSGTGGSTVGTWNLFDSTNSQELNLNVNDCLSVPNLAVTSITAEKHCWNLPNTGLFTIIACFHA